MLIPNWLVTAALALLIFVILVLAIRKEMPAWKFQVMLRLLLASRFSDLLSATDWMIPLAEEGGAQINTRMYEDTTGRRWADVTEVVHLHEHEYPIS